MKRLIHPQKLLALGLLLLFGSTLVFLFIKPVNAFGDFINGFAKGLGFVFILFAFYKMKFKASPKP